MNKNFVRFIGFRLTLALGYLAPISVTRACWPKTVQSGSSARLKKGNNGENLAGRVIDNETIDLIQVTLSTHLAYGMYSVYSPF
jgi:hypothetical protein